MSDTILALLGFATVIAVIVLLLRNVTVPALAFVSVSTITAAILVATGAFTLDEMAGFIKEGVKGVHGTAVLFIFSVLFFGVMTDAGMFDVIIGKLMKLIGNNVIGVCVMTCVIALIGHLDGGGASTFCIVVPAMLPIYKKMNMRPTSLLRIAVLAMGVLNLMPWAGPTMRAATVLGMEAGQLWNTIIPIQIFGIVLALAHSVLTGFQEKKRGAGLPAGATLDIAESKSEEEKELSRPKLFWFNLLLTIAVIAMLIWDVFASYVPFMLGVSIALFVNYGFTAKMHKKIILHAGPALMMCSTLMGAAVLMGVLTTSFIVKDGALTAASVKAMEVDVPSVVRCLAGIIESILPAAIGQHLPLVIGILSVPLALAFDTDSYFFGMLPVIIAIGQSFGVEALPIAVAMVVCRNCATFISPMVPATLLGVGLADVDIKDHIKASFLYVWVFSILCMLFAIVCGIMPL